MKSDTSRRSLPLFCFSPLVMFLTFCFEFTAALYVLWRYKSNRRSWLVITILINLGLFQIAEWQVCADSSLQFWVRIGFMATAALIPLGLQLFHELAPSRALRLTTIAAALGAIVFAGWFLFVPSAAEMIFCGGNYSLYRLDPVLAHIYMVYYWGFLAAAITLGWRAARRTSSAKTRRALYGMIAGYLLFMVPTLVSNALAPETIKAVPSILCGFAIFFAIMLITIVAPNALTRRAK